MSATSAVSRPDRGVRRTVVHFIDSTGPGGAETVFSALARGLPADRFRSIAAVLGPGWVDESLRSSSVEIVRFDALAHSRVRLIAALAKLMRRSRADVVQSHLVGGGLYGSVAARLAGARSVITLHGQSDLQEPDRFRALRFGVMSRAADRVVFVSDRLRRYFLAKTGIRPEQSAVVPNGIALEEFQRADEDGPGDRGLDPSEIVIGTVGNIRPPKGYDVLLDAAARLPRDRAWRILIAGDTAGEVYPALLEQRQRLGLEQRVTFLGFQTDPATTLKRYDVFVLPSRTEGFSLATVQALACGLPVVATRSGGPEEILGAEGGLLVAPDNATELAAALTALLDDAGLRARLATAGREIAERYTLARMIAAYTAIYDSL